MTREEKIQLFAMIIEDARESNFLTLIYIEDERIMCFDKCLLDIRPNGIVISRIDNSHNFRIDGIYSFPCSLEYVHQIRRILDRYCEDHGHIELTLTKEEEQDIITLCNALSL